jgi:3-mercaptopyruvate sulfurtransferase SseA
MSVRFVLSVIIVSMGLVAAVLPPTKNSSVELDARQLLNELQLQNHVISIDEMADALINNDPEYQLIDLRSAAEFRQFSIPGAMNIPFDSLFPRIGCPMLIR